MTTFATDHEPTFVPQTVEEGTDARDLNERVMLRHALDLLWHGGVNWQAAKAEALRRFPPPTNARDARWPRTGSSPLGSAGRFERARVRPPRPSLHSSAA